MYDIQMDDILTEHIFTQNYLDNNMWVTLL